MVAFSVGVGAAVDPKLSAFVVKRANDIANEMNWQTCGHMDFMLGSLLAACSCVLHEWVGIYSYGCTCVCVCVYARIHCVDKHGHLHVVCA